jgi:V8-like Glu-specific endopeptidase
MDLASLVQTDAAQFPAVAFIESWFPDPLLPDGQRNTDGREIGTGSLIAPRLVLTAGHIVYDARQGGQTTVVRVTLGGAQRVSVTSNVVDFPLEWRQPRTALDSSVVSPVDIGVIVLPEPVDRFAAPLPVETASDTMLAGMRLNVLGYPANPGHVVRPPPPLGTLFGTQFNLIQGAAIPDGGDQYQAYRLFYPVRTVGGVSGGPVYNVDPVTKTRTIRGVHTSLVDWGDGSQLASALRIDNDIKTLIHGWIGDLGRA